MTTTALGRRAEAAAANYLQQQGYRIIARNWRTRWCEIDIIAEHNHELVFVEVKYRRSSNFGGGELAITADKTRRLTRAAQSWLAEHPSHQHDGVRMDVITLEGVAPQIRLHHWPNAILLDN